MGCGYCGDHQNSLGYVGAWSHSSALLGACHGEATQDSGSTAGKSFRSVRSQLYEGREKKLAVVLGEQIKENCKLLEKFSFVQKSYEGHERESSLKGVSVGKAAAEVQSLEAACES
ncbi:Melanoma inhibitory activity protein 2 [Plecturocebus cupreus]